MIGVLATQNNVDEKNIYFTCLGQGHTHTKNANIETHT